MTNRFTRLERKCERLEAERDLYEMMAHDLASESLITNICKRFPAIAKQWSDFKTYANGNPMFAPDGTMLDEHGNRSIFDDVDK